MLSRLEFEQNIKQLCNETPFWTSDSKTLKFEQEINFEEEEHILFILIEFSESYAVPTLAFSLSTLEGARVAPEKCWEKIFDDKSSFVGNISVEDCKYQAKPLRIYKLHPCATPKVMEGLTNAENLTKSIVNILTTPFHSYHNQIVLS